jgi:peptidoglycan/xylan/chitin deacetylase (PgdA/CDA1 family)
MGATGTVCVTVDNLGKARDVGLGTALRPDTNEPGLKVGMPRMLGLFAELGIQTTFFIEGWNVLHHRDVIETILAAGHDIGYHGWVHEVWASIDPDQQERLLFDGTAALAIAGVKPAGFRAPGGYRGERTAAILSELGYTYDSSIERATENDPLRVGLLPNGLVEIPYHWEMNDYWQAHMHPDGDKTPAQACARWHEVLDDIGRDGGLTTFIFHPFVSGAEDDKFDVLRDVLTRAVNDPNLEVIGSDRLAARYLANLASQPIG